MDEDIQRVAGELGVEIPALEAAARRSRRYLEVAEEHLQNAVSPAESSFDVVVLGSLARMEATEDSDLDFLVIGHQLPNDPRESRKLMHAVNAARDELRLKGPGATGLFGCVVSAVDLTERIGLEADTNQTHSRRILFLEESRSVYRRDLHEKLLRAIVERYLLATEGGEAELPRFLLNDVLRYWRTLTVDYEAKRWEKLEQGWGLRYLKLRISRKLAFAGTLASIFLCEDPDPDYFVDQFLRPPLARLVQAHKYLEPELSESLAEILSIADAFVGRLEDQEFRDQAEAVSTRTELRASEACGSSLDEARRLQAALESIFFQSEVFEGYSRRYLSF